MACLIPGVCTGEQFTVYTLHLQKELIKLADINPLRFPKINRPPHTVRNLNEVVQEHESAGQHAADIVARVVG